MCYLTFLNFKRSSFYAGTILWYTERPERAVQIGAKTHGLSILYILYIFFFWLTCFPWEYLTVGSTFKPFTSDDTVNFLHFGICASVNLPFLTNLSCNSRYPRLIVNLSSRKIPGISVYAQMQNEKEQEVISPVSPMEETPKLQKDLVTSLELMDAEMNTQAIGSIFEAQPTRIILFILEVFFKCRWLLTLELYMKKTMEEKYHMCGYMKIINCNFMSLAEMELIIFI